MARGKGKSVKEHHKPHFTLKQKLILSYAMILLSFIFFMGYFVYTFLHTVSELSGVSGSGSEKIISGITINREVIFPLIWEMGISFLILVIITISVVLFILKQIFKPMQDIIAKLNDIRDTGIFMKEFSSESYGIIGQMTTSLNEAFRRMTEFDQLKANKVAINASIIRNIINDIDEGVVVLDKNKIVIMLNSIAEQHLRLSAGEVMNKSFARFVNNIKLMKLINTALRDESNIVNERVDIKKGEPMRFDVLTYVDKYKVTAGVVIVIKELPEVEENSEG